MLCGLISCGSGTFSTRTLLAPYQHRAFISIDPFLRFQTAEDCWRAVSLEADGQRARRPHVCPHFPRYPLLPFDSVWRCALVLPVSLPVTIPGSSCWEWLLN